MEDKDLLKITLIVSIIGIFILTLYVESIQTSPIEISKINKDMLDQTVKIKGTITQLTETEGLYILTIKDDESIPVIVIKDEFLQLSKQDFVEIEGKVIEYKNKTEIQAQIITICYYI